MQQREWIGRLFGMSSAGLLLGLAMGSALAETWEQLMTAEERAATGIERLSAAERMALRDWLERYTDSGQAEAHAQGRQEGLLSREPVPSEIRSRIKGSFEGWSGNTIFRLENGQVWQQRRPSRFFFRADSPEVIIRRGRASFYTMEVPAAGRSVLVQRID